MPRNGSGNYSLPQPPFTPNTTISSSAVNSDFSDIANTLTASLASDGQTSLTGILKGTITTGPIYASSIDNTTGFGVSVSGEADIWASGTKIVAITSTGEAITGNLSVSGTLNITGATTLGTVTITTATVTTENATTLNVSGILTDTNTGYWVPPKGTTAQRPGAPGTGVERYNSDNNQMEFYNGLSWQALAGITVPNFQIKTSGTAQTYTTPTAGGNLPLYLRVRMAGGGGGGGATTTNPGANGIDSSFESWTAVHGVGGQQGNTGTGGAGGAGGATGTGTQIRRTAGTNGFTGTGAGGGTGGGGISALVGAAVPINGSTGTGVSAVANSGSGGSGGNNGSNAAAGGGAGEYVEFIITSPAANYTYTVGGGGAGGAAGGNAGGNGAAGIIIVEAYWQ